MQISIKKIYSFSTTLILTSFLGSCYTDSIESIQARQFRLQTEIIKLNRQDKKNNKQATKQTQKVAGLHANFDE